MEDTFILYTDIGTDVEMIWAENLDRETVYKMALKLADAHDSTGDKMFTVVTIVNEQTGEDEFEE